MSYDAKKGQLKFSSNLGYKNAKGKHWARLSSIQQQTLPFNMTEKYFFKYFLVMFTMLRFVIVNFPVMFMNFDHILSVI